MRNRRIPLVTKLLAIVAVLAVLTCKSAVAQQAEEFIGTIPVLLQGKEIKLPEDFVARLDGNRLKVALKSSGLAERHPDRDLLVSLIQEDGQSTESRPDENGEITFEDVKEGLASIVVASGRSAYAAMAVYAMPSMPDKPAKAYEVPVATVDELEVRGGVEASGTATPGAMVTKLTDYASATVNRFQVYLQSDGTLFGQVIVPEEGFQQNPGEVTLSFFRNGTLVGRTISAADGSFAIGGLTTGIHSVFASGPPGHAAFAFEVLPPKAELLPAVSDKANGSESLKLVATANLQVVGSDQLIVLIIPPSCMSPVREVVLSKYPIGTSASGIADATVPGAPLAAGTSLSGFPGTAGLPGGFVGGYSGGGGGGFGGGVGGAGGLLGVAGLAVGVAALADNDDDGFNVNLATPVSQ